MRTLLTSIATITPHKFIQQSFHFSGTLATLYHCAEQVKNFNPPSACKPQLSLASAWKKENTFVNLSKGLIKPWECGLGPAALYLSRVLLFINFLERPVGSAFAEDMGMNKAKL